MWESSNPRLLRLSLERELGTPANAASSGQGLGVEREPKRPVNADVLRPDSRDGGYQFGCTTRAERLIPAAPEPASRRHTC